MSIWSFRSPRTSNCRLVAEAARRWQPSPELRLDASLLQKRLLEATDSGMRWILHPCLNSLTLPSTDNRLNRDFLLAVWIATNSIDFLGEVFLPRPLTCWGKGGGLPVAQGSHDLRQLGIRAAAQEWPFDISLDVCCNSLGFTYSNTWVSSNQEQEEGHNERLDSDIRNFMRALTILNSAFYDCAEWAASVTSVVIPFYSEQSSVFRSSSTESLPGVVFMDLFGGTFQVLEALVHESAHRHLYLHQAAAPLVDPAHTRTYRSPLRIDPRPLHGIFLAYHALAFICAFYRDAERQHLIQAADPDCLDLRSKLDEAETVLTANRQFLTKNGQTLFEETLHVAEYART